MDECRGGERPAPRDEFAFDDGPPTDPAAVPSPSMLVTLREVLAGEREVFNRQHRHPPQDHVAPVEVGQAIRSFAVHDGALHEQMLGADELSERADVAARGDAIDDGRPVRSLEERERRETPEREWRADKGDRPGPASNYE